VREFQAFLPSIYIVFLLFASCVISIVCLVKSYRNRQFVTSPAVDSVFSIQHGWIRRRSGYTDTEPVTTPMWPL